MVHCLFFELFDMLQGYILSGLCAVNSAGSHKEFWSYSKESTKNSKNIICGWCFHFFPTPFGKDNGKTIPKDFIVWKASNHLVVMIMKSFEY